MRTTDPETRPSTARTKQRDQRLQKFAPVFRRRIAALTCCAPEAEDLIESFPALLVALVSDFGSRTARAKAFEIIISGGSLKAAASTLGLPIWLKKMPAEAFQLPINALPTEAQFTTKITNFVPENSYGSCDWLNQVGTASDACDSIFALWVAKHCSAISASRRKILFSFMAAWAWHASRPDTVGGQLIDKPWSPKMGLRRATEELMRWRRRADLACIIGDGIKSPWLESGHHDALEFVPLVTLNDFLAESRAMNNCLDQYADRLGTGLIRIFSIRSGGRPVADIEVGPITTDNGQPTIVQIKGPNNRRASAAVWQAAQKWLAAQPLGSLSKRPGQVRPTSPGIPAFWCPYFDWLPASRHSQFEQILLARRFGPTDGPLPHPLLDARASMHRASGQQT